MNNIVFVCNSLKLKYIFPTFNYKLYEKKLKQQLSEYFGVQDEQLFLFGAARMGLYIFLKSLHLKPTDEVIVCGYTCVVVTNAIKYAGAKAIYVDINEQTLNIDEALLEKAINQNTKAVIIAHNFGILHDFRHLKQKYPSIIFIEDAAHTFSSTTTDNKKAGTLGDASFFSFEYSKPLTSGMGGLLIVNNHLLLPIIQEEYTSLSYYKFFTILKIWITLIAHYISNFTFFSVLKRFIFGALNKLKLIYTTSDYEIKGNMPIDYPVKLHPTFYKVLYHQLKNINYINERKKYICEVYNRAFKNLPHVYTYYDDSFNMVRFPLVFDKNVNIKKIQKIKEVLIKNKINVGEWFNDVVHPKGSYRYNYVEGMCRIGESLSYRIINFPVNISSENINKYVEKIVEIIVNEFD